MLHHMSTHKILTYNHRGFKLQISLVVLFPSSKVKLRPSVISSQTSIQPLEGSIDPKL